MFHIIQTVLTKPCQIDILVLLKEGFMAYRDTHTLMFADDLIRHLNMGSTILIQTNIHNPFEADLADFLSTLILSRLKSEFVEEIVFDGDNNDSEKEITKILEDTASVA